MIRLGTRGSALALAQARLVADALEGEVELVPIRTSGDEGRRSGAPVQGGDKARFVKELEEALLAGDIDLAVHSAKDVPTELPDGLAIVGVPGRADPRDAICGVACAVRAGGRIHPRHEQPATARAAPGAPSRPRGARPARQRGHPPAPPGRGRLRGGGPGPGRPRPAGPGRRGRSARRPGARSGAGLPGARGPHRRRGGRGGSSGRDRPAGAHSPHRRAGAGVGARGQLPHAGGSSRGAATTARCA